MSRKMKRALVKGFINLTTLAAMCAIVVNMATFEWPECEDWWLIFQIPTFMVSFAWLYMWGTSKLLH